MSEVLKILECGKCAAVYVIGVRDGCRVCWACRRGVECGGRLSEISPGRYREIYIDLKGIEGSNVQQAAGEVQRALFGLE